MFIKRFFWVAYKVYVFFVFFITLIPFYPIFRYLLANSNRWERCFIWQVRWGKVVRFLSGIKIKITGIENLPKAPYVVISNHASYIDTFIMYGVIPDYFVFMGMSEITKWPMFRWFFKSGQNIAVNRSSIVESARAFKKAEDKIKQGNIVAIFPEGGIKSQVPELAPFKDGAFKLASKGQVPILPILFFDTHKILESNNLFQTIGKPGTVHVKILKSVLTQDVAAEDLISLRQKVRETMQLELDAYYGEK